MMPHVGNSTYDIVYDRQSPNAGTIKISWKVASGNFLSSLRKYEEGGHGAHKSHT